MLGSWILEESFGGKWECRSPEMHIFESRNNISITQFVHCLAHCLKKQCFDSISSFNEWGPASDAEGYCKLFNLSNYRLLTQPEQHHGWVKNSSQHFFCMYVAVLFCCLMFWTNAELQNYIYSDANFLVSYCIIVLILSSLLQTSDVMQYLYVDCK